MSDCQTGSGMLCYLRLSTFVLRQKRRFNWQGLGSRSFFKSQEKANPAVFVNFLENVLIHVCREVAYLLQPNVGLGT